MEENKFVLSDVVVLNENEDSITILDQTQLPAKEVYETITEEEALIDAIKKLKVRGAPAIGVAAAFGVYVCVSRTASSITSPDVLKSHFQRIAGRILSPLNTVSDNHPAMTVPSTPKAAENAIICVAFSSEKSFAF